MADSDPTHGNGEARAQQDDCEWFACYTPRNFRMREPYPFEFGEQFPPDGMLRQVIVQRSRTGEHVRAWIRLSKDAPFPANNDQELDKDIRSSD